VSQTERIPDFEAIAETEHEAIARSGKKAAEFASLMGKSSSLPDDAALQAVAQDIAQRVLAAQPPTVGGLEIGSTWSEEI
jgi:hypothetical protein